MNKIHYTKIQEILDSLEKGIDLLGKLKVTVNAQFVDDDLEQTISDLEIELEEIDAMMELPAPAGPDFLTDDDLEEFDKKVKGLNIHILEVINKYKAATSFINNALFSVEQTLKENEDKRHEYM